MKVYLDSIGCRLNQSEIEQFANQFRVAGHILVPNPGEADLVVVNTCTVTTKAASDSRQKARQAAHAGAKDIVLTGCWATLEEKAALALPSVSQVISNTRKDRLVQDVLKLDVSQEIFDREPLERQPLPGLHLRTRAFIKVQDGCDNHCTFCITKIARGVGRSREVKQVIDDIQAAVRGGAHEVVLTGVQLGSWGQDFPSKMHLGHLIENILKQTGVQRLRLSSLEPWNLEENFFDLWDDTRLCRHLHLPLQSGSGSVLRRMARKTTPEKFANLVAMARKTFPKLAITTDIIVGFPGETEADFKESLDFVRQIGFAAGHVFTYSERPGTPAARFDQKVPMPVRKERNKMMQSILSSSEREYRFSFLGIVSDVLWELTSKVTREGWQLSGLTDNYLRVYATASEPHWNKISTVQLTGLVNNGMQGEIIAGPGMPEKYSIHTAPSTES